MARVITFSRTFPAYHPRAGQQTYFIEKLIAAFDEKLSFEEIAAWPCKPLGDFITYEVFAKCQSKFHTIRAGNRWKVRDKFSPRFWSGKPYKSKQIVIAPDTEIVKIWNIEIHKNESGFWIGLPKGNETWELLPIGDIAINDGLDYNDFVNWFNVKPNKPFKGQIICWSENINY